MENLKAPTSQTGPLGVPPKKAWEMLGIGNTRGYELLESGELKFYFEGRHRMILVASIHARVARLLEAAERGENPNQGPLPIKKGSKRPRKEAAHAAPAPD